MIWIGIIMAAGGYVGGFIYYWRESRAMTNTATKTERTTTCRS